MTTKIRYYTTGTSHTRISDAECVICSGGTWTATSGTDTCTNCVAGKFLLDDGQTIAEHNDESDCEECAIGSYNPYPGSDNECISCDAALSTGATSCGSACDPGKYTSNNYLGFELTSNYWHFLGLLWVYLFFFLRFF